MQPLITRTVHASRAYSMIAVLGIAGALRLIVAELRYRRTLRRHFSDGAIMAMKNAFPHHATVTLAARGRNPRRSPARWMLMNISDSHVQIIGLIILSIALTFPRSRMLHERWAHGF